MKIILMNENTAVYHAISIFTKVYCFLLHRK